MKRVHTKHRSLRFRLLAGLLSSCLPTLGCPPSNPALAPRAGQVDFQRDAWVPVGPVQINAIGGNLHVRRVDLSIDTRLGTREIAAVWDLSLIHL